MRVDETLKPTGFSRGLVHKRAKADMERWYRENGERA